MNRFEYLRPDTVADASKSLAEPNTRVLAGGTNLVDLMKYDVAKPSRVVDINRLPLKQIELAADGSLTIGPLVTTRLGSIGDSTTSVSDRTATLKWNAGVHNFLTYMTGDIPVGGLRSNPAREHRSRSRRHRWRRRLHVFQSGDGA
jgi:hypothetical protein